MTRNCPYQKSSLSYLVILHYLQVNCWQDLWGESLTPIINFWIVRMSNIIDPSSSTLSLHQYHLRIVLKHSFPGGSKLLSPRLGIWAGDQAPCLQVMLMLGKEAQKWQRPSVTRHQLHVAGKGFLAKFRLNHEGSIPYLQVSLRGQQVSIQIPSRMKTLSISSFRWSSSSWPESVHNQITSSHTSLDTSLAKNISAYYLAFCCPQMEHRFLHTASK